MTTQVHSPYQDYFNRLDSNSNYYSNSYNNENQNQNLNQNQINSNINENLFEADIDFHNIARRLNFDDVVENDDKIYLTQLISIELDRLRSIVSDEECCTICLETYSLEDDGKVCSVCCTHFFYTNCMSNWLMTGHQTCPMCRTII
jgi:hypothetical protein